MEEAAYGDRNVVLLSSTQSRWSGFPLNRQGVLAKGYLKGGAPSPSHSIVLTVAGSIGVEVGGARGQRRFVAGPGSITIWPKGFHLRWISWTSLARPCEAINVELDAASLAHLAPSEDALADGL